MINYILHFGLSLPLYLYMKDSQQQMTPTDVVQERLNAVACIRLVRFKLFIKVKAIVIWVRSGGLHYG